MTSIQSVVRALIARPPRKQTKNGATVYPGVFKQSKQVRRALVERSSRSAAAPRLSKALAVRPPPPRISANANTCTIRHSEYVSNINGTVDWHVSLDESINPSNSVLFPWLSNQSANWQSYRFKSLNFKYITRVGAQIQGAVQSVIDYDPASSPFSSEQEMASAAGFADCPVWQNSNVGLKPELANNQLWRYNRPIGMAVNSDLRLYDVGSITVATTDFTAAAPAGKLYVDYEVEFKTAVSNPLLGVGGWIQGRAYAQTLLGPMPTVDFNTLEGFTYHQSEGRGFLRFTAPGNYLIFGHFQPSAGVSIASLNWGAAVAPLTAHHSTVHYTAAGEAIMFGNYTMAAAGSVDVEVSLTVNGLCASEFFVARTTVPMIP